MDAERGYHTVTVTLSGDQSPYVPMYAFKCHAPEGASCRQRCRNDDICEGGDAEGHVHEWYDSGECWMLGWWDNDDATPENLVEPFVLKDLPVKGWWAGDYVEWKFVGSDLLAELARLRAVIEEAQARLGDFPARLDHEGLDGMGNEANDVVALLDRGMKGENND